MKYETYVKGENGKFIFVGWNDMNDEKFCINTKLTKKFIYKTYKWLNDKIEEYRYTRQIEEVV